jgi:hypothetical protein
VIVLVHGDVRIVKYKVALFDAWWEQANLMAVLQKSIIELFDYLCFYKLQSQGQFPCVVTCCEEPRELPCDESLFFISERLKLKELCRNQKVEDLSLKFEVYD